MKVEAYTDGSHIGGVCSYGCVILQDGELTHEIRGQVEKNETHNAWNVAGELWAVRKALDFIIENIPEATTVIVYYDYKGVEAWATGEWKARKDISRKYKDYIFNNPLEIVFEKVKAHSGNYYNDVADQLAKEAIAFDLKHKVSCVL